MKKYFKVYFTISANISPTTHLLKILANTLNVDPKIDKNIERLQFYIKKKSKFSVGTLIQPLFRSTQVVNRCQLVDNKTLSWYTLYQKMTTKEAKEGPEQKFQERQKIQNTGLKG